MPLTRHRLVLVCCVATVAVAALGVYRLDPAPTGNVARGARVITSSEDPAYPDVQRTVDGDLKTLGFHTLPEDEPWVVLDLGAEKRISRVRIFNRGDCCILNALPLAVEVAPAAGNYTTVGRQEAGFYVCEHRFAPVQARFVRVRLLRRDVLHLREIEVY